MESELLLRPLLASGVLAAACSHTGRAARVCEADWAGATRAAVYVPARDPLLAYAIASLGSKGLVTEEADRNCLVVRDEASGENSEWMSAWNEIAATESESLHHARDVCFLVKDGKVIIYLRAGEFVPAFAACVSLARGETPSMEPLRRELESVDHTERERGRP